MKENRTFSFIAVTLVYLLAAAVGILVYELLPYALWLNLLLADVAATVFTFMFSLIFKNASVYDPYWSVQPIVIVLAFAFGKKATWLGVLLMITICLWGIRLTANWAYTFRSLNAQDWRYTMLHEKTGKLYFFVNLFGIHLVPTLIVYACVMPAVAVITYMPPFNAWALPFIALSVFAFTM